MLFMLLLHGDESAEAALSAEARRAITDEHMRYSQELRERGVLKLSEPLAASAEGTVVRPAADGRTIVTDGPFAETKEQLGGFYLIECADRDEAVEYAKRIPRSPGLAVEIRAVPSH
jgi:hypothetical protein